MFEKLLEAITALITALNAHTAALGAESPKAAKGKAAAGTAAASNATPAAAAASTAQPAGTAVSPSSVSATDAGNAMVRVCNEVSRDTAVAILKKYGAETFAGVSPAHYATFKADCDAALKPAPAPTGAAGLL